MLNQGQWGLERKIERKKNIQHFKTKNNYLNA